MFKMKRFFHLVLAAVMLLSCIQVPSAYAAADRAPGLKPGTGLTLVSWSMRVIFLISPPLVGALADSVGLRLAILFVPLMGLLAIVFARSLRIRGRGR